MVKINPDLAKERHQNLDVEKLKFFLGQLQFQGAEQYEKAMKISKLKKINLFKHKPR